ncbi:MAG: 50S ribosomal protein L29 [Chloroflexi bacterium]|nr:50S ribosomal protein L29 [Chloroflexota bacterium]
MVQAKEIRQLSNGEIEDALEEAKLEMFNLRFQLEIGQLEDPTRIKEVKRDIARYKTILREREIAEQLVREEEEGDVE